MGISKINTNGQVSIPASIRRRLGLKAGDFVSLDLDPQGGVRLVPVAMNQRFPDASFQSYDERGVDLSLLRRNLKKTPTARLERHHNMLALVKEARKAGTEKRGRI